MTPPWLTDKPQAVPPAAGARGAGFLEKTVREIARFAEDTLLSDRTAAKDGLLQRFHPSLKLPALLALIVGVSFLRTPSQVWSLYLLPLVLARLSGIPLTFFLKRVWLFVPLFTAAAALPALFNVVVPGEPLFVVARFGGTHAFGPWRLPAELAVTREGVQTALLFVGRVAVSVSLTLLLTLTTRFNELFQALATLKVPELFIMILSMTYRYVVLLTRGVGELHVARQSRTVRYLSGARERRWVASRMGHLFRRSYRMSFEVHSAMLARGFGGEAKLFAPPERTTGDYLLLFLFLALAGGMVILAGQR